MSYERCVCSDMWKALNWTACGPTPHQPDCSHGNVRVQTVATPDSAKPDRDTASALVAHTEFDPYVEISEHGTIAIVSGRNRISLTLRRNALELAYMLTEAYRELQHVPIARRDWNKTKERSWRP